MRLNRLLVEISWGSSYPFQQKKFSHFNATYTFKNKSGTPYYVQFREDGGYVEIVFGTEKSGKRDTESMVNQNDALRTLSTVFNVVAEYRHKLGAYKEEELLGYVFYPSERTGESVKNTARSRIYIDYIKKAFPHAEVEDKGFRVVIHPEM